MLFTTVLYACGPQPVGGREEQAILPWENDSSYFAWGGSEPVLLLGAGNDPFLKTNWRQILEDNHQAGGNYLECVLVGGSYTSRRPFAYDTAAATYLLDQPDSIYWRHLAELVETAADKGIVINLVGSDGRQYGAYDGRDSTAFRTRFAQLVQQRTGAHENLIYVDLKRLTDRERMDQVIGTFNGQKWYAEQLLGGAGAVDFPFLVDHQRTPSESLSAVRAVRTVESLIAFWDLRPAPEILLNEAALVTAARTESEDYVIHLAGPATVRVRLDTEDQVPVRVTVVGYLGTRRSEVLQPPYGSVFELSTEDERGAWLVMQRLK